MQSQVSKEIDRILSDLDPALFGGNKKLAATLKEITELDRTFAENNGVYLHTDSDPFVNAERFREIHLGYKETKQRPSLPALALHHAERLGLDKNSPDYKALILVAIHAEIKADAVPDYHNPYHFTDVAAMTANLLHMNTGMAAAGVEGFIPLTKHEQALTLIAAMGHDLGHKGLPNPENNPFFNEQNSFQLMKPLLEKAGLAPIDMKQVETVLLTTSPNGPHSLLKQVAHLQREKKPVTPTAIDPEGQYPQLHMLAQDLRLTQMAAIVSDSDLYASSGAGMEASMVTRRLLMEEMHKAGSNVNFSSCVVHKYFMDNIVGKDGYASAAGRAAANESFQALRAEIDEQVREQQSQKQPSYSSRLSQPRPRK